jgi:Fic family protein
MKRSPSTLLYLSHYFKLHRSEYYDRLQAIRDAGDWEGWLKFYLRGVFEVSQEATETARHIVKMREDHRQMIMDLLGGGAANGLTLLESLYWKPIVSVKEVVQITSLAYPNANNLAQRFVEMGLLREMTGQKRNRRFIYDPYFNLFPT